MTDRCCQCIDRSFPGLLRLHIGMWCFAQLASELIELLPVGELLAGEPLSVTAVALAALWSQFGVRGPAMIFGMAASTTVRA